jgi:repressor LexA
MEMPGITPRQMEVLRAAAEFQDRHGYSATIAELAETLRASRPTVHEHLSALAAAKLIVRTAAGKARSLRLTERGRRLLARALRPEQSPAATLRCVEEFSSIPLAGVICAGYGIENSGQDERLGWRELFGRTEDLFALRVKGSSMVNAGIQDGDYVICHRQATAENGQVVAAIVDGERAMLKRFFLEPSHVRLKAENDAFEPIYSRDCRIEGVVIGVIRRL